ncbi:hypothetical protein [Sphaerisporangium rufum]|nr:hypothetical protein [Sphaerisporangium rufum]
MPQLSAGQARAVIEAATAAARAPAGPAGARDDQPAGAAEADPPDQAATTNWRIPSIPAEPAKAEPADDQAAAGRPTDGRPAADQSADDRPGDDRSAGAAYVEDAGAADAEAESAEPVDAEPVDAEPVDDEPVDDEFAGEPRDDATTAHLRMPAGPFLRPGRRGPAAEPDLGPERPPAGPAAAAAAEAPGAPDAGERAGSPAGRPAAAAAEEWEPLEERPVPSAPPPVRARRSRLPRPLEAALLRIGDIPIRTVYATGAALATVVIVVLIFTLFSGDRPAVEPDAAPSQAGGGAAPSTTAPPPIAVPKVPAARAMTVFTGTGTPVLSYVVDRKAGVSYAGFGAPWKKASLGAPFTAGQKAGAATPPRAMIGSAPVPVTVGTAPVTDAQYRALAGRVVKWTLRYQPPGAKFSWTVSQRARYGPGWMLGYKVTYPVDGKKRTSQAYVMVIGTAKKKPAMIFANVPDTRKALDHDLNMLYWTARAG